MVISTLTRTVTDHCSMSAVIGVTSLHLLILLRRTLPLSFSLLFFILPPLLNHAAPPSISIVDGLLRGKGKGPFIPRLNKSFRNKMHQNDIILERKNKSASSLTTIQLTQFTSLITNSDDSRLVQPIQKATKSKGWIRPID